MKNTVHRSPHPESGASLTPPGEGASKSELLRYVIGQLSQALARIESAGLTQLYGKTMRCIEEATRELANLERKPRYDDDWASGDMDGLTRSGRLN